MQRVWMTVGAVMTMLSVAIGAFGAHMLKEKLAQMRLPYMKRECSIT